jgi:AraC-like DNA-binding protein
MEAAKKEPHSELERHYTLAQIADAWHVSESTVHRYFINEPGVLKLGHPTRVAAESISGIISACVFRIRFFCACRINIG